MQILFVVLIALLGMLILNLWENSDDRSKDQAVLLSLTFLLGGIIVTLVALVHRVSLIHLVEATFALFAGSLILRFLRKRSNRVNVDLWMGCFACFVSFMPLTYDVSYGGLSVAFAMLTGIYVVLLGCRNEN
jgi:hypothetical protein